VIPLPILIIEGNHNLRHLLTWHLQQAGYSVEQAANIAEGREKFYAHQPTLAIVDSDLPDGDGIELTKWLQNQPTLVFILSAKDSEAEIVRGLKAGADDYLTKPFGMQEFLARVEALLRRSRTITAPAALEYGDLKIDLIQRRVHWRRQLVDLTPQEFSLLYVLAQVGGNALSRSDLLRRAWPEAIDNPRTIDTHILSLRKKIETDPRQPSLIQTVRNVGYRLNWSVLGERPPEVPSERPYYWNGREKTKVNLGMR
jgi:two-component system, OmpR family, response regulator